MVHRQKKTENLRESALEYHRYIKAGKLEITPTKPLANQRDLSLAYSPGVAEACKEIVADPENAFKYTARGNLVAVITDGTAVLGLGNIGPLASKPVMEGKAVLFKKFADIDAFDIEIKSDSTEEFIKIVKSLEPTFGAINLEDIGAPACFEIEKTLDAEMDIPIFHDDQHGTAITVAAAVRNGLFLTNRDIKDTKIVTTGGGAAGIACLDLLVEMGADKNNITLCDASGVVYKGRNISGALGKDKERYARDTKARELGDVIAGADLFLGLSAANILKKEMVKQMAANPIILALANPDPEISPNDVKEVRDDAIIATGRSDFPNQVNNVLCFPFLFRAALDVGAKTINSAMKIACADALADLARSSVSDEVSKAYGNEELVFGKEYLIPKPFDTRLLETVTVAIAKAAMDSGNATRPIKDLEEYQRKLQNFLYRSGLLMKDIFFQALKSPKRIVFAEGEDNRVLHTAQDIVNEGIGKPILVGRPKVLEARVEKLGLKLDLNKDIEICNPESDVRYKEYWQEYYNITQRDGVSPDAARHTMRTSNTAIAAVMVKRKEADAMICGTYGRYGMHLKYIERILGLAEGYQTLAAMPILIFKKGVVFIADAYVNENPSAHELVDIAMMAVAKIRQFNIEPQVAFISNSNFGSLQTENALKMKNAVSMLDDMNVDFKYEGEMHVDIAVDHMISQRVFPNTRLTGPANLFVFSNAETALVATQMLRTMADGLGIGPILLGVNGSAHIVTPSVTTRGLFNISATASATAR